MMLDFHLFACLIFSWIPSWTTAFLTDTSSAWLVLMWVPSRSMALMTMRIDNFMRLVSTTLMAHSTLNMNLNDRLLLWHVSWWHIIAWWLLVSHGWSISWRRLLMTSRRITHWLLKSWLTILAHWRLLESHGWLLISHWWLLISHRRLLKAHRRLLKAHRRLLEAHRWLLVSRHSTSDHWWLEVWNMTSSLSLWWVSCLNPKFLISWSIRLTKLSLLVFACNL